LIALEKRARYVEAFLDRYDTEEQLIQKTAPQTRIPITRKHGHD
jgi:hypothetical protein